MFIGISLSILYTFIYMIIQIEDYALLVGSIELFIILRTVMYFSIKIDWRKKGINIKKLNLSMGFVT